MNNVTSRARGQGSRRTIAVVIGALVAIVLLAAALLLSNAYGAARIAENARAQHWTNAAAGTASLTRAANGQAVFFAVDRELGVASDTAVEQALVEAESNLADLKALRDEPDAVAVLDASAVLAAIDGFIDETSRVHAAIADGEAAGALDLNSTTAEAAYNGLRGALTELQRDITDRIDSNESVAGLIGNITRFAVTLLIPAAALIIYRSLVKRQALRRELEIEARLQAELELRKSKDEFIASISHEIRTPLTSIYGFSELLVETGMVDPDSTADLVGMIHSESIELSRMVEDLLTAARVDAQALDYSIVELDLRDETEVVAAPLIRRGERVDLPLPDGVRLMADSSRLRQVLRNLLSNALRHGGDEVRIEAAEVSGKVEFRIIDNGPGVPREVEARLFEKFVHKGSTPLLVGSVGLGLSVARSIMEGMGGDLRYERVDGETHFIATLPAAGHVPQTPSGDPFAADAPGSLNIAASQTLDPPGGGFGLTGGQPPPGF